MLLYVHCLSTPSWHTLKGLSLATHRSLPGQSADVMHSEWQRMNAQTRGREQSELM
jgi:hypothetical protein